MKVLMTLFVCIITSICFAQEQPTYEVSDKIDLPQVGWNKVLMMRNGNTMLFHFEPRKGIIVKVFDSTHKEIASLKHICNLFDINQLDACKLHGFYDINGEAVLFAEQQVYNKKTLLRLRFDANTGKLLEERRAVQSASLSKEVVPHLMKDKNSEDYSIFCFSNIIGQPGNKLELQQFDGKSHQLTKTIPLIIDPKPYKNISVIAANMDVKGDICVTLLLVKELVSTSFIVASSSNYEKKIAVCYLPKGANDFFIRYINVQGDMQPYFSHSIFNEFDNQLDILVLDSRKVYVTKGTTNNTLPLLLTLNENDLSLTHHWLISDSIKYGDRVTKTVYNSVPIKMFTNKYGLTTIISEDYILLTELQHGQRVPYTDIGNLVVKQYDSKGNELWKQEFAKKQFVQNFVYPEEVINRTCKYLFRDLPEQAYQNQFIATNCYNDGYSTYLFYNDLASNFDLPPNSVCKPIYTYNASNSIYYKVDRKRNVTKHFLFGRPAENESRTNLLESADFNEKSKTYTTLMLQRKDNDYTFHIAWCHL